MERAFIIDKFNTFYNWRLILTAKAVTPPQPKTKYISIDGMSGTLDLSEALTGEITYEDRTISASFLLSEGTYKERNKVLRDIINNLHGRKVKIIEPDDPTHYFYGRVTVKVLNNKLSHGEISIEAICDPWRYSVTAITRRVEINDKAVDVVINNNGAKTLNPKITVTGSVEIAFDKGKVSLTDGTYKVSDLRLYAGANLLKISGRGVVIFKYEEADL